MQRARLLTLLISTLLITRLATASEPVSEGSLPAIDRLVPYLDADYGFRMAVPEGWSRIIAAEAESDQDALEPGYAVGFESPRSNVDDHFADYVMVEILPGAESGAFETDGNSSRVVMVDDRVAVVDELLLQDVQFGEDVLDLVVYQAEIVELGFTVGIFVIGEQHESAVLSDAFELTLKTFSVPDNPFDVS